MGVMAGMAADLTVGSRPAFFVKKGQAGFKPFFRRRKIERVRLALDHFAPGQAFFAVAAVAKALDDPAAVGVDPTRPQKIFAGIVNQVAGSAKT